MIHGQMTHAPAAPHSAAPHPSPLAQMLMHRAQVAAPAPHGHPGGMVPQAPGAPMQVSAGGHPAARAGHMPQIMPGM